jgi:hypothetical protein
VELGWHTFLSEAVGVIMHDADADAMQVEGSKQRLDTALGNLFDSCPGGVT